MWRLLRIVGLLLATLYVIGCTILFVYQRSILYAPTRLPGVAEAFIERLSVDEAELALSVHNGAGPHAIIYFGGNGEEVSARLDALILSFPNHGIYLQHYRGYGGSTGEPSEEVLHADAQLVYDLVKSRYDNIVVMGRSLGTGVAIRLAAANPASHLVLISPYDSILNVARRRFPLMPMKLLLLDEFQSIRYAPEIQMPVLIIKAETDRIIPHAHTDALLDTFAPGITRTVTIQGAGHNTIWAFEKTYMELAEFIVVSK